MSNMGHRILVQVAYFRLSWCGVNLSFVIQNIKGSGQSASHVKKNSIAI